MCIRRFANRDNVDFPNASLYDVNKIRKFVEFRLHDEKSMVSVM